MKPKTFRGNTMAEALEQVKREFGRDAVILSTRTVTKGGVFGMGSRSCVEITAASPVGDFAARRPAGNAAPAQRRPLAEASAVAAPTIRAAPLAPIREDVLLSEVGSLRSLVLDLVRQSRGKSTTDIPAELFDAYLRLIENAVADDLARRLVVDVSAALGPARVADPKAVRAELAKAMHALVPASGPIRMRTQTGPTVIALVGPTGVGKTTTIAKLAANLALRERRRVGLVTIDTYRIAAVEQLRTYAQILDLPLEVVTAPLQLKEAIARMADRQVVLVDTAGRSQRDELKIRELKGFFQQIRPHEIHLVLSSACSEPALNEAVERFRDVGIDRIIFTKLDEAVGLGVVLNCLRKANAKLSYVTAGQDVPDDIAEGEPSAIADMILGSRILKGGQRAAV